MLKTLPWHGPRELTVFPWLATRAGCQCADVGRLWKPRHVTQQQRRLLHTSGLQQLLAGPPGRTAGFRGLSQARFQDRRRPVFCFQSSFPFRFLPGRLHVLLVVFQTTATSNGCLFLAVIFSLIASLPEVGLMCSRQILVSLK